MMRPNLQKHTNLDNRVHSTEYIHLKTITYSLWRTVTPMMCLVLVTDSMPACDLISRLASASSDYKPAVADRIL